MNENPTRGPLSSFEEMNSNDIEEKLKELDNCLKCPICYDYFQTCVITDCSHIFCSLCVRKSIQFKNECPKCFKELYDKQLRPNRIVDAFVSVLPGLTDCLTRRLRTLRTLKPNTLYVSPHKSTDDTPTTKHHVKKRRILADQEDENHEEQPSAVFIKPAGTSESPEIDCNTPKVTIPHIFQSPMKKKSSTTTPRSTAGPKVQCPICAVDILERNINLHLDKCLERQSQSSERNSDKTNQRAYLPKLVLRLMSTSALRTKAKEYGLNPHGDNETLKNRIQKYTVLYNAECDKVNPCPVAEIIQLLEKEEKALSQKLPKSVFSATDSGSSKEELAAQYLKANKSHFNELISNVRNRKTDKKTTNSRDDAACSKSSVFGPALDEPSTSKYVPISSCDAKVEIDTEELKIEPTIESVDRGNENDGSEELFPITRKRPRTQRLNFEESESSEEVRRDIQFVGVKNEPDDLAFDAFTDEDNDVDDKLSESPVLERYTRSKRKAEEEQSYVLKSTRRRHSVPLKVLREKSEKKYKQVYDRFMTWRAENKKDSFSEDVVTSYLQQMSDRLTPNTLWSIYSMLKKGLSIKHGVDLGEYDELTLYLSQNSKGYRPKKVQKFTKRQIEDFILNASDDVYLVEKVACLLGLAGACTRYEFINLTTDDVVLNDCYLFVNLPEEKAPRPRDFAIVDTAAAIIRKYMDLRPESTPHNRFFLNYYKGHCTTQPIGINKMGKVPTTIAQYLGLSNAESYAGHSFRVPHTSFIFPASVTRIQLVSVGDCAPVAEAEDESGTLILP